MLLQAEYIHHRAAAVIKRCGTQNPLQIAEDLGIYVHYVDELKELLGMYTCIHRERHILLNANMDERVTRMVCGHEIGHDCLHRDLVRDISGLQEFTLFDIRSETEYEANAFCAHLMIEDGELIALMRQGYDVVQLSSMMGTNVNLMLIKLNELNRMGRRLKLPYVPHGDFLKQVKPEG